MKKAALLTAVCLLILLAIAGVELLSTPSAVPGELEDYGPGMQGVLGALGERGAGLTGESSEPKADPDRVEIPTKSLGTLIVDVVTAETSIGMAGVAVIVTPRDGGDALLGQRRGTTDQLGQARFEALDPGIVDVRAGPRSRTPVEAAKRIDPGENELRLQLPEGIRIDGLVVDADGRPAPGAAIMYFGGSHTPTRVLLMIPMLLERPVQVATADSAGRFRLDYYLRGGLLGAAAPGHLPSPLYAPRKLDGEESSVFIRPPSVEPLQPTELRAELQLELGSRAGHLDGSVVDETGHPLHGAQIDLIPPSGRSYQDERGNSVVHGHSLYATANEEGGFSLDVPENFHLIVRAAGHALHQTEMEVPPGTIQTVQIVLPLAGAISGSVRNAAGVPVSGARITAGTGSQVSEVRADATGAYRIDTVPIGVPIRVSASADDYLSEETSVQVQPDYPVRWDPELRPMSRLRGRIIDEVGRPLVSWHLETRLATRPSAGPSDTTETAWDGGFDFSVLPDVAYVLLLRAPGQWLATDLSHVGELFGGGPPIVVTVDGSRRATAGIEGILRAVSGHPIAGANLQLYDGFKTAMLDVQTDEDGRFVIAPLLPRHYRLQAWGSPLNLSRIDLLEFDLVRDQHLDLGALTIASQGELNLSIARGDSGALDELSVGAGVSSTSTREGTSLRLDDQGKVSVRLPVGDYTLFIRGQGVMSIHRELTLTESGLDLSFDLYVGGPVMLDVRLTDASAVSPRESATVTIQGADENTPLVSHVVILDGKLFEDLEGFGLPPRPGIYPLVLAPGIYSVSLTTDSGQEFVGTLSVPERGEPGEAVVVYCSPR